MRNMRFNQIVRVIRPVVLMAVAMAGTSGCSGSDIRYGGVEGVPLTELDFSGPAPEEITLLGPDRVLISQGSTFGITVDDASKDPKGLRFVLKDRSLGIMRTASWTGSGAGATIRVSLPSPPRKLGVSGSGDMVSDALAGSAEVMIAGSGDLETPRVDADALAVSIAGSGTYHAAGRARSLDVSLAGSGDADLEALKVDRAQLSIAGSGDAAFASDGEVNASIMGSGSGRVRGSARCTAQTMGSGSLICESRGGPA